MRLLVNKGIPVVDLEPIAAGVDNGSGQIQIKVGKVTKTFTKTRRSTPT